MNMPSWVILIFQTWIGHNRDKLLHNGKKLMQLLADHKLIQHVHETTRENNILDLVISTEEQLIVNLKIIDKI